MTVAKLESLTIERFESADIDVENFNHTAHIRIAWLYLSKFGLAETFARFDSVLQQLVAKLGAADKYHATITWFFILLIHERMNDDQPWDDFSAHNQDLFTDARTTLSRYYTTDVLSSQLARQKFLLPNRLMV